jgi:hypothetical protein
MACGTYAYFMIDGRFGLPRGIGSLRVYRTPSQGEECRCRFLLRDHDSSSTRFDFWLVDASDRCLVAVEGYVAINLLERR